MSRLFRSALTVAIFFGLEKFLGFLRQVLIGKQFGLSATLDAFNAANNIPDLLFALISGGALAIAFIPVLAEYREKGSRPALWDLFSRVANLVFLVTAGLSILVALFAEPLVGWRLGIAPGFTQSQQALVAELMRLNLIATLLFSLAGLSIAGLQANQHFLLPALAPSMYDLGTLFGVLILAPVDPYQFGPITLPALGLGIHGIVYGTILGAALFFLVQVPGLFHFQFRWAPRIDLKHPGVAQVISLMLPRVLTMACVQFIFFAQDNLASRLVEGSVTSLVYGWLFMQVPETLIGTAIGTVLLPTLSEQVARQEMDAFRQMMNRALRVILGLALPAAVLVAIGVRPLVGILGFGAAGTDMVVWVTRAFLLGLVGHSLLEVTTRAFYACQDPLIPLAAYGGGALGFILLAIPLALALGSPGIALANSLVFTSIALVLLFLLNRRFPGLLQLGHTPLRVLLACLAGGGVAALILLGSTLVSHSLPSILFAIAAMGFGAIVATPFIMPEVKILIKL